MNPLDSLNLLALALLLAATALSLARLPGNWLLLLAYAAMAAALLLYRRIRIPGIDLPRLFARAYPLLYIAIIFDSLARLVPILNTWRADEWLRRIDHAMLGLDPTVYLQRWVHPALVEINALFYISYFILPFLLIALLWRAGRNELIFRWAFIVSLALYANYALYFVVPAMGPRFHIAHDVPLRGVMLANPLIKLLNILESNKFDVFPSAHVNVAIVTLYGFARYCRRHTGPVAVAVAGICISTVYLRYHYVVDVWAGAALAGLAILGGEWLYARWRSRLPQEAAHG